MYVLSRNPIRILNAARVAIIRETSQCSASLNEYFTSPTINESVLTLSVDEFSSCASFVNIQTKVPKLYFHPVSAAWLSETLTDLNIRRSACPDETSLKLLKIAAPVIAGPMTKPF